MIDKNILDELWLSRHPKDALFLEIIEGYSILELKDYPGSLFYMKDKELLIHYELKTKFSWINYSLILLAYSSKFSLIYDELIKLIKCMLETHLNLQTTLLDWHTKQYTWDLEKYLKLRGTVKMNFDVNWYY